MDKCSICEQQRAQITNCSMCSRKVCEDCVEIMNMGVRKRILCFACVFVVEKISANPQFIKEFDTIMKRAFVAESMIASDDEVKKYINDKVEDKQYQKRITDSQRDILRNMYNRKSTDLLDRYRQSRKQSIWDKLLHKRRNKNLYRPYN